MKKFYFEKGLHILACFYATVAVTMPFMLYLMTQDVRVSVLSLAGCLLFCILAYLLHRLHDWYITGILADLPKLMDLLIELEEKEIFPENEDTIVSKLQNRVIKLVRILKQKQDG